MKKLLLIKLDASNAKQDPYSPSLPLKKKKGENLNEDILYVNLVDLFNSGGYSQATAPGKETRRKLYPDQRNPSFDRCCHKEPRSIDQNLRNSNRANEQAVLDLIQFALLVYQYAILTRQNNTPLYKARQMTVPFPSHLDNHYCKEEGNYRPKFTEAYGASHINNAIPRKEKDPGSFTLPCFINNFYFDKDTLLDLDRTVKYLKGIAENVLVGIGKFTFPVDFIILDMPEDIRVPLILRRPFLSTALAKIEQHLDAICAKYFVPEEVYPQLPSSNATMHERPTGKIGIDGFDAFIRTADPRKVRIVERAKAKNERPIVWWAKHRTVTLLPTSVVRSSGELSASVEREFAGDTSVGDGETQAFKEEEATRESKRMPAASHPPKGFKSDYGTMVVFLPYPLLIPPYSFTFEEARETCAKSADPEVDSLVSCNPADVSKDKSAPHPSVFGSSSSSEKTDRTLSLFTGRSGSGFDAGSIRAEEAVGAGSEEIYVPEWTVTKGFEMNDGRLCANMIDHFTPPAFFKTVRGMEHEQLFTEFNVSAARNLSLSSEVRMRAEYNILEKRKWRSLAEEKNTLLEAKDKEIEDLKSQLLRAREESAEVTQLRAQVSGLEATENSLRGEVASAKDHNILLEQECDSLKLKVTGLESAIVEKDHELSELGASSSSLKSQNQSLVDQVHELEISSADLREKLEMYEGLLKRLEEFQDNLMGPLRTRLAEIDADFTRCCMRFQESFHPHLLNVIAGRRWLLTHGMKLLVVKCLNSNEYMEALGHAFGRAIEKGMQEGLAAGIEHGQAGRCLTDLEAYIPSVEDDFNSAITTKSAQVRNC
ncbi:hypothetical protein Tco_1344168 [Tanacetum coccineum]